MANKTFPSSSLFHYPVMLLLSDGNVRPRERIFKKLNFYQRTYLGDGIHSFLSKAKP